MQVDPMRNENVFGKFQIQICNPNLQNGFIQRLYCWKPILFSRTVHVCISISIYMDVYINLQRPNWFCYNYFVRDWAVFVPYSELFLLLVYYWVLVEVVVHLTNLEIMVVWRYSKSLSFFYMINEYYYILLTKSHSEL